MKIVFLSPLFKFADRITWMDRHYDNFNALGDRWEHIIFTDADLPSRGNIKVVRMDNEQFMDLVESKTGVRPYVPAPSPKFGDCRPAFGLIFEEYIKGADFWGHTDFDVVFGDMDAFLTDEFLSKLDIYGNEPGMVNGICGLYRNVPVINNGFKHCEWQKIFQSEHYHAFDEGAFSQFCKDYPYIKFVTNFWQENDNQEIHKPTPRLRMEGKKLYNSVTGEEIMMFHFRRTKVFPV